MTQEEYIDLLKYIAEEKIVFNDGECKKSCNCIEIAEEKNGGNPVKQYQCLRNKDKWKDLI